MRSQQIQWIVLALGAVLVAGCKPTEVNSAGVSVGESAPTAANTSEPTSTATSESAAEEPAQKQAYEIPYPDRKPKDGEEVGVFETEKGRIVFMFFPDKAPKHVAQVKKLIGRGFYDGTRFHRCIAGFMIQGGDPNSKQLAKSGGWGTGGYEENGKEVTVPAEFTDIKHKRGVMSAARGGHDINSASSQFFIMVADYPSLDGQYSAWGQVLSGMEAADEIVKTGTGQNGEVEPGVAVLVKTAKLAKWPVK